MTSHKFRMLQVFCGIGGKGLGAAHASVTFGDSSATFETIGGIDIDPLACRDFEMLVGAPTLCVDLHELTIEQLIAFVGPVAPDVVMMSPPCKGFSGLLSSKKALEDKYQQMNALMLRTLFLLLSAWPTPPKLIFVENVPRIASRGREIVRQSIAMGEAHGYAVAVGTHDCGELGGLAQHRRRWFMLWRHRAQVAQFVYEPPRHRVRACGEVLGELPIPGDVETAGPMHSVPRLSWRNWLRLAMIPAGGDWRDLPGTLAEGQARRSKFRREPVTAWTAAAETVTGPGGSSSTNVADPRVAMTCRPRAGAYGVLAFDHAAPVIAGDANIDNARVAVADPRIALAPNGGRHWNKYAVTPWDAAAHTITGTDTRVGSGAPSVADPRFGHVDRVAAWDQPSGVVTSGRAPSSGGGAVADPRIGHIDGAYRGVLGVSAWSEAASTVTGNGRPQSGRFSVADPRFADGKRKNWQQVSGVTPWTSPAPVITSGADLHAGAFQVADPRAFVPGDRYRVMTLAEALELDLDPAKPPPWIPIIIADDGTWHRPLTTLELAVLQSFPHTIDGKPLRLAGNSHMRWRQGIGNAVPPLAGLAVANELAKALLVSALGAFALGSEPIWVAPSEAA